jgi:arsenate reductase
MIQIFGTKKCKGTRAAQRFFSDRGLKVHLVDVKEKGPSAGELASVARAVGGIRALYDPTRDPTKRYAAPTDAQLATLLVEHPDWLATPIVRRSPDAVVGADEDGWKRIAEAEKAG